MLSGASSIHATDDWLAGLVDLLKIRSRTVLDIVRLARPYLTKEITYGPEAEKQWKDKDADVLAATRERLASTKDWSAASLDESLRQVAESLGISAGAVFQPLRVALTGQTVSPGILDVLQTLDRERSLARIDAAIRYITKRDAA